MNDQVIMCVECLRIVIRDLNGTINNTKYHGKIGSNHLWSQDQPSRAEYCVNGTYYCAMHALPVYEATPSFIIEESV